MSKNTYTSYRNSCIVSPLQLDVYPSLSNVLRYVEKPCRGTRAVHVVRGTSVGRHYGTGTHRLARMTFQVSRYLQNNLLAEFSNLGAQIRFPPVQYRRVEVLPYPESTRCGKG